MEVKQIANVLDLMEFFAEVQRPATLAEISKHFGWPRSSTFNLLSTLLGRGYLYEPRAKEGYYPSSLWSQCIDKIQRAAPTPPQVREMLEALQAATNETVVLAVASGSHALFVETIESSEAVRYSAPIGKRVPLHATATGRALLSLMPEGDRASILRKAHFTSYTGATLLSVDAVENEIRKSLKRGHFEGVGEYSEGLSGFALPLRDEKGDRQFALLVGGPMFRMTAKRQPVLEAMRKAIHDFLPEYSIAPSA
ncbi:MAG: IclR family transcriptional regulator [Variovorax sp.]|nr:IclR family transcriptional regulator [Variovorax sp.]